METNTTEALTVEGKLQTNSLFPIENQLEIQGLNLQEKPTTKAGNKRKVVSLN